MSENELKLEKEKFELEKGSLKMQLLQNKLKVSVIVIFIIFEIAFLATIIFQSNLIDVEEKKSQIGIVNFDSQVTIKSVDKAIKKLDMAIEDENVKEILFIMNSPGGSPSASEELSEYLKEVNKEKKVTMYIEAMAASGGYYIASAIKPLKANKNAIVGSIGVILQHYNLGELAKKVGIEEDNLPFGDFKQPISLFKKIDKDSEEYLKENLLSPMYNNFVQSVADNREKKFKDIDSLAQGRVFLANDNRIKDILIDEITSLYKVKKEMKSKYKENITFVELKEKNNFFSEILKGKLEVNISNLTPNISNSIQ